MMLTIRRTAGFILAALISVVPESASQTKPLVIAWQAPASTTSMACGSTNGCFTNFTTSVLPHVSGIGATVTWSLVDNCSDTGGHPYQCQNDPNCPGTAGSADYKWCALDTLLVAYTGLGSAFANKKIILIIYGENDAGNVNTSTPEYVYLNTWASAVSLKLGYTVQPQDETVCSDRQGDVTGSSTPIRWKTGFTSIASGDFGLWNINQCTTLPNPATSISCTSGSGSFADYSGFPVVYEKPILIAYQEFLSALAKHYSPLGNGYGPTIAPYIAYVRVGMSSGGESYPYCSTAGALNPAPRPVGSIVPAGYIVGGIDGNLYVATGAGGTAATGAMPTCGSAGCLTQPDGTVPGWYNSGSYSVPPSNYAVWPGPLGEFSGEAQGYTDNGYLSQWPNASDGVGYVATMANFLSTLGTSFPFTISTHFGPPSNTNNSYPDSGAAIAFSNHIGFGMQSASVNDPVTFAAGAYPTTRENWAHNFQTYPAPVHHLQTNDPGTTNLWSGYAISGTGGITVGTVSPYTATVTCLQDCSWLYAQEIYISGNSNPSLNGTWAVSCTTQALCGMDQLTFSTSLALSGASGNNGTVWSADYWPIVLPFATLRSASSIELWECSLDYAFDTDTTASGCAPGITSPPGGDISFKNPLVDAQNGQPIATHVLTGVQSAGVTSSQ